LSQISLLFLQNHLWHRYRACSSVYLTCHTSTQEVTCTVAEVQHLEFQFTFYIKVKVNLSLCFFNWAPCHEGVLEEWRYSSTHSWPRH
jgi:hypothetical protein